MTAEQLVSAARLWDEDAIARYLDSWCRSTEGSWFTKLEGSQISGLERRVGAVRGSAELRKKVGEHVEAAVKRSKNKPPWTEAHGRSLMAVLDRACELAVHGNSSEAKLFSKYEGTLAGDDAGRLRAAREEGILRAVLAMLAKMRRAMKMEGQAQ
jgi:hypothetical protein